MAERRECEVCHEQITIRKDGQLRVHWFEGEVCKGGAAQETKGIDNKAARYLAQGRVKVVQVAPSVIVEVQGTQPNPYVVRRIGDVWSCPCEAKQWRCAHVVASSLVVAAPAESDIPLVTSATSSDLDELLAID